jgi:deoxyribose-phosphate aldolase
MAKDLKALNRSVAQLAKQITKTDLINADDASVATELSNETQPRSIKSASGTNRTNASLTRQTTKSK